jgi:hypothetical protein
MFIGLRGIQWGPEFALVSALVFTVDQILIEDRVARDCAGDRNIRPDFFNHKANQPLAQCGWGSLLAYEVILEDKIAVDFFTGRTMFFGYLGFTGGNP